MACSGDDVNEESGAVEDSEDTYTTAEPEQEPDTDTGDFEEYPDPGVDTSSEPFKVTPAPDDDPYCVAPAPYTGITPEAVGVPRNGLVGWFRGDVLHTLASGDVCRWEDLSGSDNHLVDESDARPTTGTIGGMPAVNFDASGDILSRADVFGIFAGSARTFIVVTAQDTNRLSARSLVFAQGAPGTLGTFLMIENNTWQSQGRFGACATNNAYDGDRAIDAEPHVISYRLTSMTIGDAYAHALTLRVDGIVQTLTPTGQSSGNGQVEDFTAASKSWMKPEGTTGELLVYNRSLSDAELTAVESYLTGRYGL